jgi:preprotein translocase subunit SecF
VRGINYSIEFTGGTAIQIRTTEAVGVARLREALRTGGIAGAEVTTFGSDREYLIRARLAADAAEESTRPPPRRWGARSTPSWARGPGRSTAGRP